MTLMDGIAGLEAWERGASLELCLLVLGLFFLLHLILSFHFSLFSSSVKKNHFVAADIPRVTLHTIYASMHFSRTHNSWEGERGGDCTVVDT